MTTLTPGDEWTGHYRGYELRINSDGEVWWQVYNGTDRLHLDPTPDGLVDQFLELKPLGGRVRVTEGGDVITRREDEDADGQRGTRSLEDYTSIYVGELDLDGDLVPKSEPEFSVPVRPGDLSRGDLWPSVYDGARYSFSMNGDAWWQNSRTKKRHPVDGSLPETVQTALTSLKPEGGSFRVTPWGDVITLLRSPASQTIRDQFSDLPRVVQNIIKMRRERADLQMVPVYVATLGDVPLEVAEPPSLTDDLSQEEQDALEGWAASLGTTTSTSTEEHRATDDEATDPDGKAATADDDSDDSSSEDDDPLPEDDPVAWIKRDMDKTEERINDR